MAPNPKIKRAIRAMQEIGIHEDKVKPVLKKLLNLYDKKWDPIESENYRVLADAIFDEEDTKVSEPKNDEKCNDEDMEEAGSATDEVVSRPFKRLRILGQSSCSYGNDSTNVAGTILKNPKVEESEPPPAPLQQQSLHCSVGKRTEVLPVSPCPVSPQPASPAPALPYQGGGSASPGLVSSQPASPAPVAPHHGAKNKGKQIEEPRPLAVIGQYEPYSHSSQMHFSSKGKEPEPGIIPKKRAVDTHAMILPKEKPFNDDMPQDEVPIAIIHPDSTERGLAIREFSTGKSNSLEPPESLDADEIVSPSASMSKRRTGCELATVPDEVSSSLEIASSPLGDVKISLSYNNSALGRQNFQLPTIEELRELMEQRCLRSYKIIDPNFDIIKILNDMCECISELATDSSNQLQESYVMPPALDVLKRSPARNALDFECNKEKGFMLGRSLSGSFDVQRSSNGCVDKVEGKELLVLPQHDLTLNELRWLHDASDITKGEEKVEISWVNEINRDFPPPFQYISENLIFRNAHVSFSLYRIGDESCCSTCFGNCLLSEQTCGCACQAGRKFAYSSAGVVEEDFLEECISMTRDPQQGLLYCRQCPLERSKKDDSPESCKGHLKRKVIKECWSKCGCHKQCGNRVVQRGVNYKLQVFLTPDGKGWGLRTLEELPKGAFVCEFVGEILTVSEFYARNTEKHTCPVLLDAFWGINGVSKDEEALCLDATCYGNIARFINHRCSDANLIEIPVEVETPDHHYYHLAFFTTREVQAFEELTWDYGIDFDDLDHPVKAFCCRCGSKFCRNMKRSTRSNSKSSTIMKNKRF